MMLFGSCFDTCPPFTTKRKVARPLDPAPVRPAELGCTMHQNLAIALSFFHNDEIYSLSSTSYASRNSASSNHRTSRWASGSSSNQCARVAFIPVRHHETRVQRRRRSTLIECLNQPLWVLPFVFACEPKARQGPRFVRQSGPCEGVIRAVVEAPTMMPGDVLCSSTNQAKFCRKRASGRC